MIGIQRKRRFWQALFFMLFLLTPVFDIFRFDLNEMHFIIFQHPWLLDINPVRARLDMMWDLFFRFFLPAILIIALGVVVSWKWGRLYCGWLCPHYSVVEIINNLVRRASGKITLWDADKLPQVQQDGTQIKPHRAWWLVTAITVLFFSFIWAVVTLTYLLPPSEIYGNLWHGKLTFNQSVFIGLLTLALSLEFTLARHLFCRYGCSIGLFQSLVWMINKKAMVVGFDRQRATLCTDCDSSCELACPMQLKPRSLKRNMFTCTQCMKCVESCENVQANQSGISLLKMLDGQCALDVSGRGLGNKPSIPAQCFATKDQTKPQRTSTL